VIELDLTLSDIYTLYLYFLELGLRNTSKALEPFIERSYAAIWWY